ncbi:hypothetical protein E8E11_007804 [Didymella keratinophila]|nr:hypothetical protein E8E11_007804 [Didymella keratinophila]
MEPHKKGLHGKSDEHNLSRLESHAVGTTQLVEQAGTRRAIKSRHAQMIAIGGTIGTDLFVGSGQALAIGGPGFLFLAYTLTSLLVYGVVTAVIEVCTYLPVSASSMAYYGARFASPSLGFALSWLYVYSFGILVAYEITAAAIVINYWPNNVHIAVWITIILVVIVALNFSPVGIFAESELCGEMYHPRKNLPIASRRFFYRLAFFYVFGALAIGAICRSDAQNLTSGAGNANASPWVIAIRNAGISILPSIVNGGILTSAWSAALAGNAPKIFKRCNSYGLTVYAVCATSLFPLLAYLSVSSSAGTVFNWFISLTNTAGYTSWIVCCIIFMRFRKACAAQHVSVPYQSKFQPYGAYTCLVVFTFTTNGFLTTYLGIPIFLVLWVGHKVVKAKNDPWLVKPLEVDLTTGLAGVEADAETWERMEAEKRGAKKHAGGWWKRLNCLWA